MERIFSFIPRLLKVLSTKRGVIVSFIGFLLTFVLIGLSQRFVDAGGIVGQIAQTIGNSAFQLLIISSILFTSSLILTYLKADIEFTSHRFKPDSDELSADSDNLNLVRNMMREILEKEILKKIGDNPDELIDGSMETLPKQLLHEMSLEAKYDQAFHDLKDLKIRIDNQIQRLVTNSNLNLLIGILTTSLAVAILGYSIFSDPTFESSWEVVAFYIPRISTVIFVELFSFFFLKLYRNNLLEIKYFQNEITNLSFNISAMKIAMMEGNSEKVSEIISSYTTIDRNKLLKTGETTEKIETIKLDNNDASNLSKSIKELISAVNVKK